MKRVQKQSFSRSVRIRLAELDWKVNDLVARIPQHHRCSVSKNINGKRTNPLIQADIRKVLGL